VTATTDLIKVRKQLLTVRLSATNLREAPAPKIWPLPEPVVLFPIGPNRKV
jgi:hypothetical protein